MSDNVNHAVQVVAEVISGQGQTRFTKHTHKSAGKSNTPSNDKQYFQKYRSLSGQCYDSASRVVGRKFYNKNTTPTQIESLLVRPLTHSINIFKANAQKQVARSYACVVKNRTKNQSSSYKYCKGGVFWARKGVNIPISKTEARTPVGSKEFNTNASSSKQPSRCDQHDSKARGAPIQKPTPYIMARGQRFGVMKVMTGRMRLNTRKSRLKPILLLIRCCYSIFGMLRVTNLSIQ